MDANAGASWNTVFSDTTAYFNQIACFTAERCIVVGEGASDAQILVTDDGGASPPRPSSDILKCSPGLSERTTVFVLTDHE